LPRFGLDVGVERIPFPAVDRALDELDGVSADGGLVALRRAFPSEHLDRMERQAVEILGKRLKLFVGRGIGAELDAGAFGRFDDADTVGEATIFGPFPGAADGNSARRPRIVLVLEPFPHFIRGPAERAQFPAIVLTGNRWQK